MTNYRVAHMGEIEPTFCPCGIARRAFMIQPGCRHRAVGRFRMAIVPIPVFDPADEWFDESAGL